MSESQNNHPRNAFVFLGGLAATCGLVATCLFGVGPLFRSQFATTEPVDYDYDQITNYGIKDANRHVRLVNVEFSGDVDEALMRSNDYAGDWSRMFPEEFVSDELLPQSIVAKRNVADMPQLSLWTKTPTRFSQRGRLRLDSRPMRIMSATAEMRSGGTVTGWLVEDPQRPDHYVLRSTPLLLKPSDAASICAGGLALSVLGLVVCGAGGPSFLMVLGMPVAAILSLLGYPLRYRRGRKSTRIVYGVAGVVMIAGGVTTLAVIDVANESTDIRYITASAAIVTLGAAAIAGAVFNGVATRLDLMNVSVDDGEKSSGEKRLTFDQACGMDPNSTGDDPKFEDADLRESHSDELPSPAAAQYLVALHSKGFTGLESFDGTVRAMAERSSAELGLELSERGEQIDLDNHGGSFEIIQASYRIWMLLSSDGQSVAVIEQDDCRSVMRLVSVMNDGMPVMTFSSDCGLKSQTRYGTGGIYQTGTTAPAGGEAVDGMIASHRDRIEKTSGGRGTQPIQLVGREFGDLYGFTARALAHIQFQYGETQLAVSDRRYGRFAVPPEPIQAMSLPEGDLAKGQQSPVRDLTSDPAVTDAGRSERTMVAAETAA